MSPHISDTQFCILHFTFCLYIEVWRSWGRFRAHPVGDQARNKEWQPSQNASLGDARCANGNRKRADNYKKSNIEVWRNW